MDPAIKKLLQAKNRERHPKNKKATSIVRRNEPLLDAPTKLREDLCRVLEDYVEDGALISTACKAAGVSQSTYRKWLKRGGAGEEPYATFKKRMEAAEARFELNAIHTMKRAADGGKWQAMAWILERRDPDAFGKQETVKHEHEHKHNVEVRAIAQLPDNGRGDRYLDAEIIEVDDE